MLGPFHRADLVSNDVLMMSQLDDRLPERLVKKPYSLTCARPVVKQDWSCGKSQVSIEKGSEQQIHSDGGGQATVCRRKEPLITECSTHDAKQLL